MLVRQWPSGHWLTVGIGMALHGGISEFVITKHDTRDIWSHHDEFIAWMQDTILTRMMVPEKRDG
jgi:hypothetical protein